MGRRGGEGGGEEGEEGEEGCRRGGGRRGGMVNCARRLCKFVQLKPHHI